MYIWQILCVIFVLIEKKLNSLVVLGLFLSCFWIIPHYLRLFVLYWIIPHCLRCFDCLGCSGIVWVSEWSLFWCCVGLLFEFVIWFVMFWWVFVIYYCVCCCSLCTYSFWNCMWMWFGYFVLCCCVFCVLVWLYCIFELYVLGRCIMRYKIHNSHKPKNW